MHFSKEEKAGWLEDWQQSGKSVWAYAKANGFVPQTFARWVKERAETRPVFVEVPAPLNEASLQVSKILVEKGNIRIHIPVTVSNDLLRAVIEALGAAV